MQREKIDIAGQFNCVVEQPESGWFGETSEKKTPYIRIPVIITEEGKHKGKVGVWQGWLSDAAFDNTIARLATVFGFNGDLQALHEGKVTLAEMPCNITTEEEEYDGKKRIRIAWLNEHGGGGAKPMDTEKVSSLIKKLNSRSKAIAKEAMTSAAKEGKKPKDPQKAAEAPQSDPSDDVPF